VKSEDLERLAIESYYINSDMIRFLLIENLALKNMLYKKGMFTVEELETSKKESVEIFDKKVIGQIEELKKKLEINL
jgi:hypothetical protein